jgi:hypothetical protein
MRLLIICKMLFTFFPADAQTDPPPQKALCDLIRSFNHREFDNIYDKLNPDFRAMVDRQVFTGGLVHVHQTNGPINLAYAEQQTHEEGSYYIIAENGTFRIVLSLDAQLRIDGLRIKQLGRTIEALPLASVVFPD